MIDVASGDPYSTDRSGAPHWAQKRLSSGFSWPHLVQNTVGLASSRGRIE
jgi:hypothetical protein